jgi:UDP:flavonoid glycosyltransferase YjiC (YdhE family)
MTTKRFLLATWGSSGDLHPFLAVGSALRRRGHEVAMVGFEMWERKIRAAGLDFVPMGRDRFGEDHHLAPEIFSAKRMGLVSLRALMEKYVEPTMPQMLEALLGAAGRFDCLLAHSFVMVAPIAAAKTGVRLASASLAPGVIPSAWAMPAGAYADPLAGPLGRFLNRQLWRIGMAVTRPRVDPFVNRLRAAHGLPPCRDAVFTSVSRELHLQLYSPAFAAAEPDWHPSLRHAGFCFWDELEGWEPPAALRAFMEGGEPPVLFTLGSSAVHRPEGFFESAGEAVRRLGRRAIFLMGRHAAAFRPRGGEALAWDYAPYAWIMPRCAAVAHQCGIGTVAQVLRAGKPSLLCPYAFDQPNNAMRLQALGVGVLLRRGARSPADFERGLKRVLEEPGHTNAARRVAGAIAAEDGPGEAARLLEGFASAERDSSLRSE